MLLNVTSAFEWRGRTGARFFLRSATGAITVFVASFYAKPLEVPPESNLRLLSVVVVDEISSRESNLEAT